jgi:hypothetical protein
LKLEDLSIAVVSRSTSAWGGVIQTALIMLGFFLGCLAFSLARSELPLSSQPLAESRPRQLYSRQLDALAEDSSLDKSTTSQSTLDFSAGGADPLAGMNLVVVMTSFVSNSNNTGQIWAIFSDDPEGPDLMVQGLQKPIGVCLDLNNDYLYVIEEAYSESVGVVYQYLASWDSKEMELTNPLIVYNGSASLTDCDVDQYGNLYIADGSQILGISLESLVTETYEYFIMYTDDLPEVQNLEALDVDDNGSLYYMNKLVVGDSGLINKVPTTVSSTNGAGAEVLVSTGDAGWGLCISEENIYYTVSGQGLYAVSIANSGTPMLVVELSTTKGVCYADGYVYFTDVNSASIYKVKDELVLDASPEVLLSLSNPYALECINQAVMLAAVVCLSLVV